MAKIKSPTKSPSTASKPDWAFKTHTSQITAPIMRNPRNCLKPSIHGPGLGIKRKSAGAKEKTRYGNDLPSPKKVKMRIAVPKDWVIANPKAVPINGAVHGDATTVAKTPVEKDPNTS